MVQPQPFKTCTLCAHVWPDLSSFLEDRDLYLEGYQASFVNPAHGLFLFTHTVSGCGTTLTIRAGLLKSIAPNTHMTTRNTGQISCEGHCFNRTNLHPCNAICDMRWVRDLLPMLRDHTLTLPRSEEPDNDPANGIENEGSLKQK